MSCCGSIRESSGSAGQTGAPGSGLPPGVLDGDLLVWDATLQLWVPTQPEPELLHYAFGNNSINTGTQFVFPWISAGATEGSEVRIVTILRDGFLETLRLLHATPVGTDDLVYTIRVGNTVATLADTLLSITLNSGAAAGSNLVNSIAVTAGQVLSMKVTGATVARVVRMTGDLVLRVS
jgi:hypothetical protein